jgi:hypothetical protein
MKNDINNINDLLEISKLELESLCNTTPFSKARLLRVKQHSFNAHQSLNSFLNQIIAFFDPPNKKRKSGFRALEIHEDESSYLQEISRSKYNEKQKHLLKSAFSKSKKHSNCLTYLRAAGNIERHKELMKKIVYQDNGWKIGKGVIYGLASWSGSSANAIESDIHLTIGERTPIQNHRKPFRKGPRKTKNGSILSIGFDESKIFSANVQWLPGALFSSKGSIDLWDSALYISGTCSIFLSKKAKISFEDIKIIMNNEMFHGDIFIKNNRIKTVPYDSDSKKFIRKYIKEYVDKNIFSTFNGERVNLILNLLSSYKVCLELLDELETSLEKH